MREEPIATEARCPVVVPADGGVGGSGWEYSHPSYCGAALCTFENIHASVQLFPGRSTRSSCLLFVFKIWGNARFVLNTNRCKKMFLGIQDCGRYICVCDMVCDTTHRDSPS